jgi:hypothetical protein
LDTLNKESIVALCDQAKVSIPSGYRSSLMLGHDNVDWITELCVAVQAATAASMTVEFMKDKPIVQQLMDKARAFRCAIGEHYDRAYKELQTSLYTALRASAKVEHETPKGEDHE